MKKTLNGTWQFSQYNENKWNKAVVPGCNYLDLINNNIIEDPFYGLNEKKTYWVAKEDWEYKKEFIITQSELSYDEINLVCDMLDTICDLYINGTLIGTSKNCFLSHSFSIKERLCAGKNTVKIVFHSPVNYVNEICKNQKTPINSNGQNGIVVIRKPQCHFGWDWGPQLPSSGISGDIYLDFIKTAKITDLTISQVHNKSSVSLFVDTKIKSYSNDDVKCKISVTCPDGTVVLKEGFCAEINIENPELWWTKELSNKETQPLYKVSATIFKDEKVIDSNEKNIGLRTLVLDRSKDQYGTNFKFILNGVPLFIKGANYIPPDSFITRFDNSKLEKLIDTAIFSNLNMLRVWGGGYYGSNELYDLCDKKGILLWQDFQFACQAYPFFNEDFLNNVKEEIEYNVKRISSHPSLALWCGNNEIEQMSSGWMYLTKYVEWTEKFFHNILGEEIRKYDKSTSFIPGSPCGISHNKGVNNDNVGDTHIWGVWHGLKPMDFYRKRMTRFCSEFGFESLPDIKAIKQYATPDDYSLTSEVFTAHQKCLSGNMKMMYYIRKRFNLPQKFEDFIYLSQITQQECIKDATEHWRRNKGRCNGAMYWQFNDCWGVCSWSSIDYYGNYKALQYTAKHFNSPLCVSIENNENDIKLYVINDLNEKKNVTLKYSLFDFIKGITQENSLELSVSPLENKSLKAFDINELKKRFDLKRSGVLAEIFDCGTLVSRKTFLFDVEKNLCLPKANIKTSIETKKDCLSITLKSDNFTRLVKLENEFSSLPFTDNYFDLLPSEVKTITMPLDKSIETEKQVKGIRIISLTDVETRKITFSERINLAKMLASPVNIGNCVFHGSIPKDINI